MPVVLDALQAAGHSVEITGLQGAGRLRVELDTALRGRPDGIVAVGGDGTVHIAINAMAGTDIPLGIIPVGTGNDIARSLGLPLGSLGDAVAALLSSLQNVSRPIDLGRISRAAGPDVWFAAACSAGLDAVVNARANRWARPRGRTRYVLALLWELPRFRPLHYRMVVDGSSNSFTAMLVCVSNLRSIGGGMLMTPQARPDDGRLDLLVVSPLSRLRLAALFPLIFSGRHAGLPEVSIRQVSAVELEVANVQLFADGEPVGVGPVRIDVVPGALNVLA